MLRLTEIVVADSPAAWAAAGFTVIGNCVPIGQSFCFRLTGAGSESPGGGVTEYSLLHGDATDSAGRGGFTVNGLAGRVVGPADWQVPAAVAHANSVTHAMKAVILTGSTEAALADMLATVPGLPAPAINDHDANGVHYVIWPMADQEVGLELVSLDPSQSPDAMAACFLVVDDLAAAIAAVGKGNVLPVEQYGGRDMVRVKPRMGVTAGICLIAAAS